MMNMLGKKGFTMIELIIVLLIVASLAAVAFTAMRSNAYEFQATEAIQVLGAIKRQLQAAVEISGGYVQNYLDNPTCPVQIEDVMDLNLSNTTYYDSGNYYLINVSSNSFNLGAQRYIGSRYFKVEVSDGSSPAYMYWDSSSYGGNNN